MKGFILTPRAISDIDEIWEFSFQYWGFQRADMYVDEIRSTFERIAADPKLGKSCDAIRSGYFRYPSGSHVVFYRLAARQVEIVRILHQRMDFEHHF